MYPFESVRCENKCHCRFSTLCLIFYDDFQMMFQYLWNRRDNQALWCLSTCCLVTYVEFRYLLNTIKYFNIYFFRKPRTFSSTLLLIISKFITLLFSITVLSEFFRLYGTWKLSSWTSVTSLKIWIPQIYVCIPSISYFVYRGSLKTSYAIWSRITFKHWLLFTEYPSVMYFCGVTEEVNG